MTKAVHGTQRLEAGPRSALVQPLIPTVMVLLLVLATVYIKLRQHNYDPMAFVDVDGWFVYELAHSLPSLHATLDLPAYRAQRILLSALAAPFGAYVPWALLGINIAATGAGTYALSRLALHHRVTPLLGCLFGLWIGTLYALHLDLTEVLAYALVLWAILFWEQGRLLAAAALCSAAVLAKETTLLYGISFLLSRAEWNWSKRLQFGVVAFVPGIIWQLVLVSTFGGPGLVSAPGRLIPLQGLIEATMPNWAIQIIWVLIPAVAAAVWGVVWLWRKGLQPVGWALLLNGLFVMSLPPASTDYLAHSTRIALAVIVALAWALARTRQSLWSIIVIEFLLLPSLLFRPGLYR